MINTKNRVSVCICTYNQAAYLETAIKSAAQQTLPPLEIIVSNDCSTDNTREVLEKLSKEISSLKIIHQSRNIGISRNVDKCLRMAKGEFIVRLDSDDYLHQSYIEKLSSHLIKYPDAGYAHGAVREINEHGTFFKERRLLRQKGYQSPLKALKATLKGYKVAANILMFRKDALTKVNFLSGRPDFGEDYHLTAAISAAGFGNVYLPEVLAFYRVWTDFNRLRERRKLIEIQGLRSVFEEVIEPAFSKNGWSLKPILQSRAKLARAHADCLGWEIFNAEEKAQIANELNKLSSVKSVRVHSWIQLNGMGGIVRQLDRYKTWLKNLTKSILMLKIKFPVEELPK